MSLIGLFPGQGSQQIGMGSDFYKTHELAKKFYDQANRSLGFDLARLSFEGPLETLTLTENAQPAILVASYIAFSLAGQKLQGAAGHSLGEYTALVAAEVLSFADAVLLVYKRGRYMQEAVKPGEGKMVAVVGVSEQKIRTILETISIGIVEIANLNSPEQTVLAGDVAGVDAFTSAMIGQGGKIIPLKVSAPFHCRLMEPAAKKLSKDLDAINFARPKFLVYSNVTARAVASAEDTRECLKKQVCASVRWDESIRNLVHECQATSSIEFGPGTVLSNLIKRIEPKVERFSVFDSDSLASIPIEK